MIKTKADLAYYLEEDRKAYEKLEKRSFKSIISDWFFPDKNYEYIKCIRKLEYLTNARGGYCDC